MVPRQSEIGDEYFVEILIQCYLVMHGGRDAYLFQPIDLPLDSEEERMEYMPILHSFIHDRFPELQMLDFDLGLLISKKMYSLDDVSDNDKVGRLLGFSCDGFDALDRDKRTYGYHATAELIGHDNVNIFSFVCQKKKKMYEKDFRHMCEKWGKMLVGNDELPDYNGKKLRVTKVVGNIEVNRPVQEFIDMLSNDEMKELTEDDMSHIKNVLYNLSLPDYEKLMKAFQPKNRVHRGIMISLLCLSRFNTMEPFFPIQYTGKEDEVRIQDAKLSKHLLRTLKKTAQR